MQAKLWALVRFLMSKLKQCQPFRLFSFLAWQVLQSCRPFGLFYLSFFVVVVPVWLARPPAGHQQVRLWARLCTAAHPPVRNQARRADIVLNASSQTGRKPRRGDIRHLRDRRYTPACLHQASLRIYSAEASAKRCGQAPTSRLKPPPVSRAKGRGLALEIMGTDSSVL